ncbi:hypothetical protein ONS95_005785 [Cadophora gregata]|uniref:uncharacterized protein n=1 Tax=Cadophora gregata TaxID=51156 RepID=UPI0026DD5C51|nr:uncharacterized protein ONS95_005785 [Cadophora gregata]KAK0103783.1 hypothetical protein ONS95_005785 [Cadophora gregata]
MSSRTSDVNLVAKFLAHPQVSFISATEPVDCIVICASAVLHQATALFRALESRPDLTKTLALCGGIGHSTPLIYAAVSKHPAYHELTTAVQGKPEARVLEAILKRHFDVDKITSQGCRILVEDESTNCGANASKTKELLLREGIPIPSTMVVVQDPTMALRTVAAFEKVFEDEISVGRLVVKSAPIFVPRMKDDGEGRTTRDVDGIEAEELWDVDRFYDLIIGEIPRLRDDINGYGPKGKGFIVHVDVPAEIEEAWSRLREKFGGSR